MGPSKIALLRPRISGARKTGSKKFCIAGMKKRFRSVPLLFHVRVPAINNTEHVHAMFNDGLLTGAVYV